VRKETADLSTTLRSGRDDKFVAWKLLDYPVEYGRERVNKRLPQGLKAQIVLGPQRPD
jgi:hypothetical protein